MCTYCQRKSGYCRTIFSSGRSVRVQGHLHLCSWAVHLDSIESDFQISRVMSTLHGSSSERKRERGGGEETLLETGGNQSLAIQGHRNHVSHSTSKALLSCSVYR